MVFEHRSEPLLSRAAFARRFLRHTAIAGGVVCGSLAMGAIGYHTTAGLDWVDALLDAAMILTGMGPVHELRTTSAKLFATFYALFSGVVFLTTIAVLFAPLLHRYLHRFHLDLDDDGQPPV